MPKEPLYPHIPRGKQPLFPHVPKGRQPAEKLPATKKPTRNDVRVEVWEERDRLHIGIQDRIHGNYYANWWDDEARQMFEDGFFKSGKQLEESVLDYAESVGLIAGGKYLAQTIELLASTEGDPIRKFCCRQCGECAPKELLEEGRFLDRISWLRSHYKEKHPGMWGKMSPMTVEDGEPVSPEYRHLVGLVSEPLPKEAY